MKFKFSDRSAAIEFMNYLASPTDFAIDGTVNGDIVDVPGIEPDCCSPSFLLQLDSAAELLAGVRLPSVETST